MKTPPLGCLVVVHMDIVGFRFSVCFGYRFLIYLMFQHLVKDDNGVTTLPFKTTIPKWFLILYWIVDMLFAIKEEQHACKRHCWVSIVKWTKKMLQYLKTILVLLVKCLKLIEFFSLSWIYFHGVLYCSVEYLVTDDQDEIYKNIVKSTTQKQMVGSSFRHKSHDLNYFKLFFSYSMDSLYT